MANMNTDLMNEMVRRLGTSNPTLYSVEKVLDSMPDGWSKHDGRWVETCDLLLDQEGVLRLIGIDIDSRIIP